MTQYSRSHILILLPIALYVLICWATAYAFGLGDRFYPLFYLGTGATFASGLLLIYIIYRGLRAFWLLFKHRPARPARHILDDLKNGPLQKERLVNAVPVFIGMAFFFSAFSSMKMMIPRFHAYTWDTFFANLDQIMHFGFAPWEILQLFVGYGPVTFIINVVYNLWLGVLFLVLYWQLFSTRNPQLRTQFFLSFVLCWGILGTLGAILFSSVGPCFYEGLLGDGRFTPLMDYLRATNEHYLIWALPTQDMVWEHYAEDKLVLGGGISAFPSVHVATAFLFMLLGRQTNKTIGRLTTIFFVFILVGSVHLGWHYAVDGYASIIVTFLIWKGAGYLTRNFLKR